MIGSPPYRGVWGCLAMALSGFNNWLKRKSNVVHLHLTISSDLFKCLMLLQIFIFLNYLTLLHDGDQLI